MNPSTPPHDDDAFGKATQPLHDASLRAGALLSGLQSGAPTGNSATNPPTPQPYQPPVAAAAPPPSPSPPLPAPTSKLKVPLPTLLGLAALGGVTLAIGVPTLMRRAIPVVAMKTMPAPAETLGAPVVIARATAVKAPILDTPEATPEKTRAPSAPDVLDDPGNSPGEAGAIDSPDAVDSPDAAPSRTRASSTQGGTKNIDDDDSDAPSPLPEPDEPARQDAPDANGGTKPEAGGVAGSSGGVTSGGVTSGDGYTIEAPAGWKRKRTRSGQRAVWTGPGGAQILVEVADDVTTSPRADWEKLGRAFEKKYKSRYRLRNIRDIRLTGRAAAAWEFELDSTSGRTTRKIDIAVHAGGRGYAILGSAPAQSWGEVSPTFQKAINSFKLSSPGGKGMEPPKQDQPEPGF